MYTEDVLLSDIETVKKFVSFANNFDFPVNIVSGKYIINGKSIMVIFGLDLSQPIEVEVDENYPAEFKEQLKQFKAK